MKLFDSFLPTVIKRGIGDGFELYLSNVEPSVTAKTVSDIKAVDTTNCSSTTLTAKLSVKGSTVSVSIDPITLSATGDVGPFQFMVIANGQTLVGYQTRKETTLSDRDRITFAFTDPVLQFTTPK